MTTRARELRKRLTEPEIILWSRLKRLRVDGYHFRRQAPFRGYILDFVCFSRRLVIELDGSQHEEGQAALRDHIRDNAISRQGFTVMRFLNKRVRFQLGGVMQAIEAYLKEAPVVKRGS